MPLDNPAALAASDWLTPARFRKSVSSNYRKDRGAMFDQQRVHLGAWATVDEGCDIKALAHEDHVILEFGDRRDGFEVAFRDGAVNTLIDAAVKARKEMRARQQAAEDS